MIATLAGLAVLAFAVLPSAARAEPSLEASDAGAIVSTTRQLGADARRQPVGVIDFLLVNEKSLADGESTPIAEYSLPPEADEGGNGAGIFKKTAYISAAEEQAKLVQIDVDLTTQRMTVHSPDGDQSFPVSSGRPGMGTPTGTFGVDYDVNKGDPTKKRYYRFYQHYASHTFNNAPMPYAVFFDKGVATHGHYSEPGENCFGEKPCSHGCVRTTPDDARIIYEIVKKFGPQNVGFRIYKEKPADPLTAAL